MKMREVCTRTGLTERTVRYWVSEKLLTPRTYEQNDRVYFDFTEPDVTKLQEISVLRRAGFSVAQVSAMQEDPAALSPLVRSLRDSLQLEAAERQRAAEALAGAESCADPSALAAWLRARTEGVPQADPEPDFGRFELLDAEERQRLYAAFHPETERKDRRNRLLWNLAAALFLIVLTVFTTLCCAGRLPRKSPQPEPGWEARISGSFDCPVTLLCSPDAEILRLGTDERTGRAAALLRCDGQEAALLLRSMGEAEAEFLQESDFGQWQPALSEGAGAAVYYFRTNGAVYEILVLCEAAEPIPLLTRAGLVFSETA